jgi:hypothetical protein
LAHYYRIRKTRSLVEARTTGQAARILPLDFSFREEADALLIKVASATTTTDEEIFKRVQRECDRIAFLTGENPDPCFARKDGPNGSTIASDCRWARTFGVAPIPGDLDRQTWEPELPVQLRLWQLAGAQHLPIAVRIVLLFQIIEMRFPDTDTNKPGHPTQYPEYEDSSIDPHPLTEAKLLRHLASHGKKPMSSCEIGRYCERHRIPAESNDPTDAGLTLLFTSRFPVVEQEARRLIDQAITRTAK